MNKYLIRFLLLLIEYSTATGCETGLRKFTNDEDLHSNQSICASSVANLYCPKHVRMLLHQSIRHHT